MPAREALGRLAVFALPSLMENCPMGLLEAMAAGVPAVATRVGGVPEVAPEGTAQLVAPGDPAALAAGDRARCSTIPRSPARRPRPPARTSRLHLSARQMTERTLALYAALRRR